MAEILGNSSEVLYFHVAKKKKNSFKFKTFMTYEGGGLLSQKKEKKNIVAPNELKTCGALRWIGFEKWVKAFAVKMGNKLP